VQCSTFYRHKGRFLVRLYETSGSKASVSLELPFQVTDAKEVDFNGNPLPKMMSVSGKVVRFEVKPWEIVTVAVM
jgi:alpha-mannosidase